MRRFALKSMGAAIALAAVACGGGETNKPDAAVENVAFAPGQGAVHGFVDASAGAVVALPDASLRLKRVSDNLLTSIVTTDVHGAYIVSNVSAGTYVVCLAGTPGFANTCSQTQFVVTAGKVNYPPRAAFSPQGITAVYGRVTLNGGDDVYYDNQLYAKRVDTYVRATTTTGVLVSGPVRANSRGQYVLRQVPPGANARIIVTSETTTVQSTVFVPTFTLKQDFVLPNRRPIVGEVQALQGGKTVRHVASGAVVRAKVIASDPDGNPLHYQWKAPGGSCPATDAAEVDCTMPTEEGVQSIYVQISDARGQYQIGRARLAVGPPNAMFSGRTVTNGNAVVANAEIVINGTSTMTNANGKFSVTVPEATRYVFTIKKDGFQTISKIFRSEKVAKTYKLLPAKSEVIDPTKDYTIIIKVPVGSQEGSTYQDAKITIKKNSIIDANGNKVVGPVTAYSSRFDHLFDKFDRMPGDTGAKNKNGVGVSLLSLGATEVNLRGPAGQKYNIAPGMPSDLEYPVHATQLAIATPTIPIWYYNETTGLWEEDGTATLVAGVYKGQAKHFSAINVDLEKVNATCIKLVVDRTVLTPPFNIRLSVPGYPEKDREIDEDVEGIVRVPPNVANTEIHVLDENGNKITNSKRVFTTGNAVPDGTNLDLASPYNECIVPPAQPITLSVDLPQNPSIMWLSRVSNDEAYADAYYATINADANLDDWKDRNDFDLGEDAGAYYFNAGDLEFGRSMHMKRRADGGMAYYVTNFADADKALNGAAGDVIATVAMEYSNYPLGGGNPKFTKFYVFNAAGNLVNKAELDNRGDKFVPGLCIVCHGGTLPGDIAAANGNTDSTFIPFDLKSYDISPLGVSGFPALLPRAMQEENFRKMNQHMYDFTNSTPAQKAMIDGLYSGAVATPGQTQNDDINHIPVLWQDSNTNKNFYNDVVRPSCRACHMSRNHPLDFSEPTTFDVSKFGPVCTSGYMPQSFVTWRNFWHSTSPPQPARMEEFLGQAPGTCTGP